MYEKSIIFIVMGMTENQSDVQGMDFEQAAAIPLPPESKVVMYNDDITPMDFVVDILVSIFNKSKEEAEQLMLNVHNTGSSVIGIYTYDIAVSRAQLTVQIARKNDFPLKVEVE